MERAPALLLVLLLLFVAAFAAYRTRALRRRRPEEKPGVPPPVAPAGATGSTEALARQLGVPPVVLKRPTPARHPIVLAHGYFGFDAIGMHRLRREYFRGVRGRLEALGHSVYCVRVPAMAGIARRAEELAAQVRGIPGDRVNIIAHSMGGLDARYAISRLGLEGRVASLTTIGTPHRGTPIADTSALWLGDRFRLKRVFGSVGASLDGIYDLTTERMAEFNRAVLDAPGVSYASVVGSVPRGSGPIHAFLVPGYTYLLKTAGPNDGMVPAASQRWGNVLGEVAADHWAQIGWSRGFDVRAFYALLVEYLAEHGL